MKKHLALAFAALTIISCDLSEYRLVREYDLETPFEKSKGKETATYYEVIDYYQQLDEAFSSILVRKIGMTDSGKPLHLVVFNPAKEFDFDKILEEKHTLLINNGIHSGEPDGIDATMMLMRDLAMDSIPVPKNTVIAAIVVYNIGGALNRNSTSRVNQNGPLEYGFRGNARNYDLNRDFIKADTKNALAFYEIFHLVKPDVFIGTHVSNGADYQYTLTHLFTQHDKLGGKLGNYLQKNFMPRLKDSLSKKGWETTPYVSVFNQDPSTGFPQFMDSPRYSSGYTTLWNTLGMMIETHMLKPYKKRVWGTYEFLKTSISLMETQGATIAKLRRENEKYFRQLKTYPLNFVPDSSRASKITFKGYEAETVKSEVTGMPRLKYNREKPYTKKIDYYNHFKPTDSIRVPKAYIIPKAWWRVITLLKENHIKMVPLEKDSLMTVEVYHIEDFKTVPRAYEGHYLHYDTEVSGSKQKMVFSKGDILVPTDQSGIRYIIETMEPIAKDSFFNWNFFDSVLQQKEHFSPYVFEDVAAGFLLEHPKIKAEFEKKKSTDSDFRENWYAQLNWIYQKTAYYEKTHLRYPVFRVR